MSRKNMIEQHGGCSPDNNSFVFSTIPLDNLEKSTSVEDLFNKLQEHHHETIYVFGCGKNMVKIVNGGNATSYKTAYNDSAKNEEDKKFTKKISDSYMSDSWLNQAKIIL
jgi:hypothetical protein